MGDHTPSNDDGLDSLASSPKGDNGNELNDREDDNQNIAEEHPDEEKSNKGDFDDEEARGKRKKKKVKEISYDKDDDAASDGSGIVDYYDDGDDDDYQSKKHKNKKKKDKKDKDRSHSKSQSKGGRKKLKKDEEAEEDHIDGTESDVERELKKRARKMKKQQFDEEAAQADIENLINEMEFAYKEDLECIENQKPATNKLRLLPKVENYLKKVTHQDMFVDLRFRGLDILTKWLSKLPNGSFPSINLRKKLVEIIATLPVSEEQIKNSDLGKVLFEMKNNPTEDTEVKRYLKEIIDKWTRILVDIPADYRTYKDDAGNIKRVNVSLDELQLKKMSELRQSIPRLTMKKSGYDFVKKPPSKDPKAMTRMGGLDECDKLMFDLKRKMRKEMK